MRELKGEWRLTGDSVGSSKISCAIDLRTTIRYEVGMTDVRDSSGGLATGEGLKVYIIYLIRL
jgi:hypothetical protein